MNAFIAKVVTFVTSVGAQIPGLLSSDQADVNNALTAISKLVADFQTALNTVIADAKSA